MCGRVSSGNGRFASCLEDDAMKMNSYHTLKLGSLGWGLCSVLQRFSTGFGTGPNSPRRLHYPCAFFLLFVSPAKFWPGGPSLCIDGQEMALGAMHWCYEYLCVSARVELCRSNVLYSCVSSRRLREENRSPDGRGACQGLTHHPTELDVKMENASQRQTRSTTLVVQLLIT